MVSNTPIVRFAPSPTGYLHVGNIRTALVNWLFAKKNGGEFHLRLDDTDAERSKTEYEEAIFEDLKWLGMEWDDFSRQRDRMDAYEKAKEKLVAAGRLYPCWETAEELDIKRKMQISRGLPPIYDRAALKLSDDEKAKLQAAGKAPHYRFLLEDKPVEWNDLIRGTVRFEGTHMSDPVLVRADGVPLYTLCSVVDDGEFGTTHILRGEDHVSNTAVQMQIFEALGLKSPEFGHMALIKTKAGELSKRTGGGDVRSLRAKGIEPMAINSYLAKIGTSDAIDVFADMDALLESFDMSKFGRAAANYDEEELERLNGKLVRTLPYAAIEPRLNDVMRAMVDEPFWESVKHNLNDFNDLQVWAVICKDDVVHNLTDPEDIAYLKLSAELLPEGEINDSTWDAWVSILKEKSGRKGRSLFMPLRIAITARHDGPELKSLLPLLGREKVLERLLRESVDA